MILQFKRKEKTPRDLKAEYERRKAANVARIIASNLKITQILTRSAKTKEKKADE